MASAMRLKHSMAPLAAADSRRNLCNSTLQDCNSNEPNFNDSTIWEILGAGQQSQRSQRSQRSAGKEYSPRTSRLRGDSASGSTGTACRSAFAYAKAPGKDGGNEGLSDANHRNLGDAVDPSSSSSSSSGSTSAAASPAPLADDGEYGIANPNYPGFEHLAAKLLKLAAGSDCEDDDEDDDEENNRNNNNNNNNNSLATNLNNNINSLEQDELLVNQDRLGCSKQALYDKPKLAAAMADAFLSSAKEDLTISRDFLPAKLAASKQAKMAAGLHHAPLAPPPAARHCKQDSNRAVEKMELGDDDEEKFNKESTEKEVVDAVPRKKEKMAMNLRKARGMPLSDRTERRLSMAGHGHHGHHGHHGYGHHGAAGLKKRSSLEILGGFDVYNIETAMPRIDLDLIESHLRAAKEEERRRRNDREEIRRRLAMGTEDADYYSNDQKPGKKPSLQARLQSGMNLQICFMNETLSDTESPGSEGEILASGTSVNPPATKAVTPKSEPPTDRLPAGGMSSKPARPLSLPLRLDADHEWREHSSLMTEADFLARQAQLQTEARMALAQAKDMAHMQMEIERQRQNASPITEMVRHTLQKVGVSFPEDRRRLSRQILTEMNVAQLQVIVNDLHTQIEYLNESLVRFLMERDDLHMEQDSMLVDIEDLTRYLGAKEQSSKTGAAQNNNLFKSNGSTGLGKVSLKK